MYHRKETVDPVDLNFYKKIYGFESQGSTNFSTFVRFPFEIQRKIFLSVIHSQQFVKNDQGSTNFN